MKEIDKAKEKLRAACVEFCRAALMITSEGEIIAVLLASALSEVMDSIKTEDYLDVETKGGEA